MRIPEWIFKKLVDGFSQYNWLTFMEIGEDAFGSGLRDQTTLVKNVAIRIDGIIEESDYEATHRDRALFDAEAVLAAVKSLESAPGGAAGVSSDDLDGISGFVKEASEVFGSIARRQRRQTNWQAFLAGADPAATEPAERYSFEREATQALTCSFCGKSQNEVRKLIAGPATYICDECVTLCSDIIAEEKRRDAGQH
jgi:hypothetical protein